MSASRVLIVYGSSYGQAAKIAGHIGERLAGGGLQVTISKGDENPPRPTPASFDGVIVGASLIVGGYQRYIRRFVQQHLSVLNAMPTAFFSVSGSAASSDASHRADAQRCLDAFLKATQWHPESIASVAGAVKYTKYNPLLRWWMKRISREEGASTDTSRDFEYTDWNQVDVFADAFAASLAHSNATVPA